MPTKKTGVSKAVKKYVNRKLDDMVEDKHYVSNQRNPSGAGGNVNNSVGSFQAMNDIAQGDGVQERLGIKIKPKKLVINWNAQCVTGDNTIRFVVLCDTAMDATQPTLTEVFTGGALSNDNAPTAPFNPVRVGQGQRLRVLADKLIALSIAGPGNKSGKIVINKSKLPSHIEYRGDGTNTLSKNNLYTVAVGDPNAGSADTPYFAFTSDLTYEDA